MGNKNAIPLKGPDTGTTQKEEGECMDSATGGVSRDGSPGPSPELLASLQSLRENSDYTLLPHSLHQIAEAYSLKEDYQWAIQFLQLEKLYHERLLSNLAALQENWESQLREKKNAESCLPAETDSISQKHIETLSQICRTHPRPSISVEQNTPNTTLKDTQSKNETLQPCHDKINKPETTHQDEEQEQRMNSESELPLPQTGHQEGGEEEEGEEEEEEEETYEEGQEVEEEEEPCEETPEEEEVKVEWPTGVPQASDKDLAKLSHTEGSSSPDGLVSILKRRRASLDGLPPPSNIVTKQNSKRKVRFSEPEDGSEQDEVGGDSCLILLLLCLVTVVISVGGTALYCTLVDTYSNICTDFTHNVDFYVMNVRRFFEGLGHWLPPRT
ncbi:consortin, connexin sorting protein b isoform X1 [Micropterus salmoides]|uniref:consortin, connexin sorting protein b isoform X1 n=1 Tax=Micropterus salmoides TaxID=27706 RepID=UPI0018EDD957|nr:consortin, connexin sorting protein b isoform X1 [Micropterus salmoides]XP_038583142.1 consortin, connexin sorting protein b isoform X1 [Micropterus salmoides]